MKRFKALVIAAIAFCCVALPASAQFKWGIQAGIIANDLKFNSDLFDSSNRVGFTGGLTAQFNLPFGLGVQGSLMYAHRNMEAVAVDDMNNEVKTTAKKDYLVLPIHLKYNISLPAISNFFRPYIFTGPSFSYMLSGQKFFENGPKIKKGDMEWDFGIGFDIVNHIQISAGYGLGCTKIYKWGDESIRTNSWTITLGYLF